MNKVIEFYKRYNLAIVLAVNTILLFFSPYVSWLWIVASVLNFFFYLTLNLTQIFCATMYYEFFGGIGTFFIVSILEMFAIETVRYVVDVIKKREKIFWFPLIMTLVIIAIFSCIHYTVTIDGFYQGAILIAFLISIYYVFVYHKKINVSECFNYMIVGMVSSLFLAVIAQAIPSYGYEIVDYNNRWQMFTFNINNLSMLCLFAIAYYVQQIACKKNTLWKNMLCVIIATSVGMLTMSKAFFIVWILLMIYLFVSLVVRFKKKSLYAIIPIVLFMLAIGLIFREKVWGIIERFFFKFGDGSWIDNVLTGRVTVWKEFLEVIVSSVWTFLFGVGLFTSDPITLNTHNSYLFLLYRIGFIGIVLIIVLIYTYIKSSKNKFKLTASNSLLFFVFLLLSCEEFLISDRFMFFLFFGILLIAHNGEDFSEYSTGRIIRIFENKVNALFCKLFSKVDKKYNLEEFEIEVKQELPNSKTNSLTQDQNSNLLVDENSVKVQEDKDSLKPLSSSSKQMSDKKNKQENKLSKSKVIVKKDTNNKNKQKIKDNSEK